MANYMKTKKRSFVAGLISFIGSLVLLLGLYLILSALYIIITTDNGGAGRIILGILVLVLTALIQYCSVLYDRFMNHKKWVKRLQSTGIEELLSSDDELAHKAYRSNPTVFGLRYIEKFNPRVAADIQAQLIESSANSPFKTKLRAKYYDADIKIKEKAPEKEAPTANADWENGETIIK